MRRAALLQAANCSHGGGSYSQQRFGPGEIESVDDVEQNESRAALLVSKCWRTGASHTFRVNPL
jgi:hypothetical protein